MSSNQTVWTLYRSKDPRTRKIITEYSSEIQEVVGDAFAGTGKQLHLSAESLLKTSDVVGLFTTPSGINGVASLSVPKSRFQGRKAAWINKVALRSDFQQGGIGTTILLNDLRAFVPEEIGFVGCMTQNPGLIEKFIDLAGPEGIAFPTKEWYSHPIGTRLISFYYCEISQFKRRVRGTKNRDINIDSVHGIIHRAYQTIIVPPSGRARFHTPKDPIKRLLEVGFNPYKGDAVVLSASFYNPLL